MPSRKKKETNQTILTFFKAKKSEIDFSSKREFIQDKLKKRKEENEFHEEHECQESQKLRDELSFERKKSDKMQHDLKKAKQMLIEASRVNLQKDIIIQELKTSDTQKINVASKENYEYEFQEFSGNFTRNELKELKSLRSGTSADYKFVHMALKYLYKDQAVLLNRTPTGKKFRNVAKKAITPDKKELINLMLKKRIEIEGGIDFEHRIGRLDYLLGQVIQNIRKAQRAKQPQSDSVSKRNENSTTFMRYVKCCYIIYYQ